MKTDQDQLEHHIQDKCATDFMLALTNLVILFDSIIALLKAITHEISISQEYSNTTENGRYVSLFETVEISF